MNDHDNHRVQELFLAALDMPSDEREAWLLQQCSGDEQLLHEVLALLEHDNPNDDPLEKGLGAALGALPNTLPNATTGNETSESDVIQMDSEHFLSKLSEVGVLSPEEIEALNQTIASGQSSANPRQIASQLVSQGKLTDYQASALLKGRPELLIDKYLILDLLDAGGMGMVFKAIHRPMNRTVAVKMIAQHLLASPDQVKRFQREVRVAATLEHPNIVRSYDADQSRGIHFLVMEYVRGDNLSRIVQQLGPMSVEQAVDCIAQAARGLRYAQKQGVIHRDIKPGNLMLNDEGIVKVLDLGLANVDESFRLAQQSSLIGDQDQPAAQSLVGSELTTAGTVLGTVSFMAPEQSLDAHAADTRADIYSLGCTLYYLLIGEAPYKGDTIFQVFMEHREGSIPALRDKRPDVPEKVEEFCQKMLAKAPKDRYQTMGQLLAAIEDCDIAPPTEKVTRSVSEGTTKKRVSPTVTLASQPSPRNNPSNSRSLFGWLTAVIVLLAIGGGYWWWQNNAKQVGPQKSVGVAKPADIGDSTPESQQVAIAGRQYGLRFDGNSDYVEIPTIRDFGTEPFTIEVLLTVEGRQKSAVVSTSAAHLELVGNADGIPFTRPVLSDEIGVGHWSFDRSPKMKVPLYRRQHLAFTYDGKRAQVFVEGKLAGSELKYYQHADGLDLHKDVVAPLSNAPDLPACIGRSMYSLKDDTLEAYSYTGTIDEVRISTSARYSEDFTPVDRFEADADTLALYHFDEGQGDVLIDSSGNGHHGKIVGAQWIKVYEEANMSAADLLATGEYEWRVVERMPEPTNSAAGELGAHMTADGLTIVFASQREQGSFGAHDLWTCSRTSVDNRWSAPINLGEQINSDKHETAPVLSPNGLTLYFERVGDGSFVSTRNSLESPWSQATSFEPGNAGTPWTTSDGLAMVYSAWHQSQQGIVSRDLWIKRRASRSAPWPDATRLESPINSDGHESHPTLSEDGRLLIFDRGTETNDPRFGNLWMATRTDWDAPWSEPVPIESLNSGTLDRTPRLLADGKSFLFDSWRDAKHGDIYLARLVRKDTSTATIEPSAADLLATGEYEWKVVETMPEPINTGGFEPGADITADGLTVVLAADRGEGHGGRDLWMVTRESTSSPWSVRTNLGDGVNTAFDDGYPDISPDGTYLLFSSRDEESGRQKTYYVTRQSSTSPWSKRQLHPVNTVNHQEGATMSSDGLTLIVQRIGQKADLFISRRSSTDALWSEPMPLEEPVNTPARERFGTISDDGRLLVFARGELLKEDLWMATRSDWDAAWSAPVLLAGLNSDGGEQCPKLLPDGKTLLFSSSRPGGNGSWDIWLARLVRKEPLSTDPKRLREQADELVRQDRIHEAIKAYENLWSLPGADQNGRYSIMGELYARTFQWERALEQEQLRDIDGWVHAGLLYQLDRHEQFRSVRRAMLSNHSKFNETQSFLHLKTACFELCEEELYPAIRALSEKLLKSKLPHCQMVAGKGFYRLGEFQTWYDALPEDSPFRKNQDPFLLAIVAFQNDPSSRNRQTLQKLVSGRESNLSVQIENNYPLESWQSIVNERAWTAEAKAVLESVPPPTDEPVIDPEASAADLLDSGEYEWRVVEELPEPISSGLYATGADMTDDGLTIVFVSDDEGGMGDTDLWMSQRPTVDASWGQPVNLGPTVNSSHRENSPAIDGEGRTLVFIRVLESGERGAFITTLDPDDATWSEPVPLMGSLHHQADITSNGLSLVIKKEMTGSGDLFLATRQSDKEPWSDLQSMGESINTDMQEHWGTMSDDGRLLIIQRLGEGIDSDFYMSTRADSSKTWSEPALVESLNSFEREARPRLLADGKTLIFVSDRSDKSKLYLARLVLKN